MDFSEQPAGKAERRAALTESIIRGQQPETGPSARDRLEEILGPDAVAELHEHLLGLVEREEVEPEPLDVFGNIAAAQAEKKARLVDALLGRKSPSANEPAVSSGFDGGARSGQPWPRRAETHDELVARILRSRADRGVRF
jgi:hypothetical protein